MDICVWNKRWINLRVYIATDKSGTAPTAQHTNGEKTMGFCMNDNMLL